LGREKAPPPPNKGLVDVVGVLPVDVFALLAVEAPPKRLPPAGVVEVLVLDPPPKIPPPPVVEEPKMLVPGVAGFAERRQLGAKHN
jgi:hypothetical protein